MVFMRGHPFIFVPSAYAADVYDFVKKQRIAFAVSEAPARLVKFEFPSAKETDVEFLVTQLMKLPHGAPR